MTVECLALESRGYLYLTRSLLIGRMFYHLYAYRYTKLFLEIKIEKKRIEILYNLNKSVKESFLFLYLH